MNSVSIIKLAPDNFVPFKQTPWAGDKVTTIKSKYHSQMERFTGTKIGESWEVSTDPRFPSRITYPPQVVGKFLNEFLEQTKQNILGDWCVSRFGANWCPMLLKWLEASQTLSVQLHPKNNDPNLKTGECGKPEAWYVVSCEPGCKVYLGFKEGLTRTQIESLILEDKPEHYLHTYFPKPGDYISVPPGCVHAIGSGVMVVEPQFVLPQKQGKTWRLSDWGRKFNQLGEIDNVNGDPRELHREVALGAIDWSLPQGPSVEKHLVMSGDFLGPFLGNSANPFSLNVITQKKDVILTNFVPDLFSLLTVVSGEFLIQDPETHSKVSIRGSESAILPAGSISLKGELRTACGEPGLLLQIGFNPQFIGL